MIFVALMHISFTTGFKNNKQIRQIDIPAKQVLLIDER